MIYLSAMDYNLPGPFCSDAEFHPRFADRCGYGKFIIRRIIIIRIFTVVSLMPIVVTVVEYMMSVTVRRSMTVVMFFI